MSLPYYFDQHMPRAIARGLERHDVDVLTTQDEGAEEWDDVDVFARAADLGRIMVTQDSDSICNRERLDGGGTFVPRTGEGEGPLA
jgi:predicted nuclease of predicted toxin-antitoxin system